jgi:photosystem I 4.8kDa protein
VDRVTYELGVLLMAAQIAKNQLKSDSVMKTGKFPYTFRTAWFLVLLAINFVVAAFYFHIIE